MDPEELKAFIAEQQKAAEDGRAKHAAALKDLKGNVDKIDDQLKAQGKEGIEQKQSFQDSVERLARVEEDLQKASDLMATLRANTGNINQKTIGELLEVKAEQIKAFAGGNMTLFDVDTKDITSATGSAGTLIQPMRETTPIMEPQPRLWLRNLLTAVPTSTNGVEWVREKARSNNAAIQASEGELKAQSDIEFEMMSSTVKTIAHFTRQSRQVMQDVPQLQGIIEDMLRYGLNSVEEVQFLNGAGTGGNMLGILPQSTDYVPGVEVETDSRIDRLRRGMVQAEDAEYPASAIVMNHRDWAEIEMQKTDDKAYLFANPVNSTSPRLWGLPVVSAPSMANGTWLLGGFSTGATIYDREQTVVRVAEMDGDDFVQNMIKVLVEKRVMIAVKRPASFVNGNFTFA